MSVDSNIADRITVEPDVMVGKPLITGTRLPVELILAKLAANPDLDELFLDYPELTLDDVKAALQFATAAVREQTANIRQLSGACSFSSIKMLKPV